MRVKKGDTVVVLAGKDKGVRGKVLAAYPDRDRVLVEGVNRIKKHTKIQSTQRGGKTGGIVTQEASIHVSNVMVVDDEGPTRVGYRKEEVELPSGKVKQRSVRVSRRTGKDL
jgi:large subunit ribosomal protein L24